MSILSSFHVTKWLFLLSWYKNSWSLPLSAKKLGWSILIHLFAKLIMGDILADTAILGDASKKESLCSCKSTQPERVFSWMGWLLKKKALSGRRICQHAIILEGQSWALDCFCHCDVFSTINWLLLFLEMDFLGNWIHISHFWVYHL